MNQKQRRAMYGKKSYHPEPCKKTEEQIKQERLDYLKKKSYELGMKSRETHAQRLSQN